MKRKFLAVLSIVLPIMAFAGSAPQEGIDMASSQTDSGSSNALGIFYNGMSETMTPMFSFTRNQFVGSVGLSYESKSDDNDDSYHELFTTVTLGMRKSLDHKVDLTYGLAGMYGSVTEEGAVDPYAVGPFVGMNYHATDHLTITAQILPYAYERHEDDIEEHDIFQEGMIGLSCTI